MGMGCIRKPGLPHLVPLADKYPPTHDPNHSKSQWRKRRPVLEHSGLSAGSWKCLKGVEGMEEEAEVVNEEPLQFCWVSLIPSLLQSLCPMQQQCLLLDHRPEMCSQRNSAMCLGGLCVPHESGYPTLTFLSSPSWGGGRKPDSQDPQNLNRHLLLERGPKPQRKSWICFY